MMNHDHLHCGQEASDLLTEISTIPCVNSHSHIIPEDDRLAQRLDALSFFGDVYPRADLLAAGMPAHTLSRLLDTELPLAERWEIFEPFREHIRLTGYSQSILEGFRGIYGVDALTAGTVTPLSEAIQREQRPGLYQRVLSERARIAVSVLNVDRLVSVDRGLFVPLPRLNRFSSLREGCLSPHEIRAIEEDYNAPIGSIDDHVEVIQKVCHQWREARVAGVKLSHANHRPLDFRPRDHSDAAELFDTLRQEGAASLPREGHRLLEDYLVFECCRAASEAGLTIQFHTGMRAANWRSLEGASVAEMVTLLRAFPDARFDLSHSGYPFTREAAILAKTFPNVYLNLSWIHIVSPLGVRRDLAEWLQMTPTNKIIAFGDDVKLVETAYGHLEIARRNVSVALAGMVTQGLLSEYAALDVARALFYDNPAQLYQLTAEHSASDSA